MGFVRGAPFLGQAKVLESKPQTLFGVRFPNPVGLAAGFDKNALAADKWHAFGFGFVELGTVTYHPQPGNPRPRLFRFPQNEALINRMGFNNDGAAILAQRLSNLKAPIPLGINLGKSKVTPIDKAAEDYQESYRLLHSFGDYFVINVSSPNTPGLRTLQDKGPLLEIIQAIREVDATRPLFVKVAPDLEWAAVDDLIDVAQSTGLTGIIATNTTLSREGLPGGSDEAGGLSGLPLREKSDAVLGYLREHTKPECVLIGVGGISTADDVKRKMDLGASLVQLYTGWIYRGPMMVPAMLKELR